MRLYDSLGPNPQIVRTFAAEKGIVLEKVPVDIMGGENRGEAFRVKNPMGQLPALELANGVVITEVVAICELLEELHPQPALIGNTAVERAATRMWVRRFDLGVLEPFMFGFRATAGRPFFESRMTLLSEGAGQEMLAQMAEKLQLFDALLAGRSFVCGERFSLADITLGCFLQFGRSVGAPLPEGLTWVAGWLERLEARGTFAA
ncbi:MAG: glutathione S-transferase family protein [Sphingomonadaceae bacterium]